MYWLPRSVSRKRAGRFKHAGIFLHNPVEKGWREKKEISFAKLSFSGMEGKMNFDEMLPEM